MILKKITIENFRCFKNYEVDLTPGITVFIGKTWRRKNFSTKCHSLWIKCLFFQ